MCWTLESRALTIGIQSVVHIMSRKKVKTGAYLKAEKKVWRCGRGQPA
jgi:hypothetical protein